MADSRANKLQIRNYNELLESLNLKEEEIEEYIVLSDKITRLSPKLMTRYIESATRLPDSMIIQLKNNTIIKLDSTDRDYDQVIYESKITDKETVNKELQNDEKCLEEALKIEKSPIYTLKKTKQLISQMSKFNIDESERYSLLEGLMHTCNNYSDWLLDGLSSLLIKNMINSDATELIPKDNNLTDALIVITYFKKIVNDLKNEDLSGITDEVFDKLYKTKTKRIDELMQEEYIQKIHAVDSKNETEFCYAIRDNISNIINISELIGIKPTRETMQVIYSELFNHPGCESYLWELKEWSSIEINLSVSEVQERLKELFTKRRESLAEILSEATGINPLADDIKQLYDILITKCSINYLKYVHESTKVEIDFEENKVQDAYRTISKNEEGYYKEEFILLNELSRIKPDLSVNEMQEFYLKSNYSNIKFIKELAGITGIKPDKKVFRKLCDEIIKNGLSSYDISDLSQLIELTGFELTGKQKINAYKKLFNTRPYRFEINDFCLSLKSLNELTGATPSEDLMQELFINIGRIGSKKYAKKINELCNEYQVSILSDTRQEIYLNMLSNGKINNLIVYEQEFNEKATEETINNCFIKMIESGRISIFKKMNDAYKASDEAILQGLSKLLSQGTVPSVKKAIELEALTGIKPSDELVTTARDVIKGKKNKKALKMLDEWIQ